MVTIESISNSKDLFYLFLLSNEIGSKNEDFPFHSDINKSSNLFIQFINIFSSGHDSSNLCGIFFNKINRTSDIRPLSFNIRKYCLSNRNVFMFSYNSEEESIITIYFDLILENLYLRLTHTSNVNGMLAKRTNS